MPCRIGTATEQAPRLISSTVVAYPSARTRRSWSARSPGAVTVCRVTRRSLDRSTSRWTGSGAKASSTLPTPVQCNGSREPTVLTIGTDARPESRST